VDSTKSTEQANIEAIGARMMDPFIVDSMGGEREENWFSSLETYEISFGTAVFSNMDCLFLQMMWIRIPPMGTNT
jgi:hypothetical protein